MIPVTTGGNAEYVNKAASRALAKKMLYNRNIVFTSRFRWFTKKILLKRLT